MSSTNIYLSGVLSLQRFTFDLEKTNLLHCPEAPAILLKSPASLFGQLRQHTGQVHNLDGETKKICLGV